jgi:hypothetical protein
MGGRRRFGRYEQGQPEARGGLNKTLNYESAAPWPGPMQAWTVRCEEGETSAVSSGYVSREHVSSLLRSTGVEPERQMANGKLDTTATHRAVEFQRIANYLTAYGQHRITY